MWKDKGLQIEIGWALTPMKQSTVARCSVNDYLVYKESGLHQNILGQIHPIDVNLFSTDDIVSGDWFLPIDGCIEKAKDNYFKLPHDRKIIASNNPSLNLPSFPSTFLEEYVKRYNSKQPIGIEVEYEEYDHDEEWSEISGAYETFKERVKINENNTISIRFKEEKPCTHKVVEEAMKIVSKDVRTPKVKYTLDGERMYSKSEVVELCRNAFKAGEAYRTSTHLLFKESSINENTWLKENLK